MLVRFWGTRGSIAKPGPDTVRYGGNTSCVEVRSSRGTLVVLDCGTGAHGLGQMLARTSAPSRGHLLIGHTHWDHIQGFPFFAPLFDARDEWHVYGPRGVGSSLRESLSGQMQYAYFPVALKELGATLHYHDLVEGTLDVGDIRVTTQYLHHPALTLGFRLEADGVTVVYSTDHEPHTTHAAEGSRDPPSSEDRRHARFLSNADLVIHDAQYTAAEYAAKRGWGHSTVEYAVDTALAAKARRLALYHHDPTRNDDAVDALTEFARERAASAGSGLDVFAAAEGLVVDFAERAAKRPVRRRGQTARADPALLAAAHRIVIGVGDPRIERVLHDASMHEGLRLVRAGGDPAATIRAEQPSLVMFENEETEANVRALVHAIRQGGDGIDPEVPIVTVRTQENPDAQQRDAEAGVSDCLIFPFSEEYARARIRAWVLREAVHWKAAPRPPDEADRVRRLHSSGLLDSAAEERFDRFTRIAAALFDVPIALVSLVDGERQWFKSRVGLETRETDRDRAFCAHAILGNDVMQVQDALADERFADNPLVTGEPRVRFYAGAPLALGDGSAVGTFCVIDHRARNFDESQLKLLHDLSKLVAREIEIETSTALVVP